MSTNRCSEADRPGDCPNREQQAESKDRHAAPNIRDAKELATHGRDQRSKKKDRWAASFAASCRRRTDHIASRRIRQCQPTRKLSISRVVPILAASATTVGLVIVVTGSSVPSATKAIYSMFSMPALRKYSSIFARIAA